MRRRVEHTRTVQSSRRSSDSSRHLHIQQTPSSSGSSTALPATVWTLSLTNLLRKSGVEVISINKKVDDSPAGWMLEGLIETADEFYSSDLGQDIERGMRQASSMGFFVASVPPYGYRKKKAEHNGRERAILEPVREEAEIVKRVFELADTGIGLKTIADRLNNEGLRKRTGSRWSNTFLA